MFLLTPDARQQYRRILFACVHPRQFRQLQQRRLFETSEGYSLRPFVERHCIFVHIPKCAGVSIAKSLFGNLAGGHASIRLYQIAFTPQEFKDYFKFTIVRNPWDRLVSAFLFLKQGGMNQDDQAWAHRYLSQYDTFESFIHKGLTSKQVRSGIHFRPQSDFICGDSGRPELDFIGYYENLEPDFSYICKRLGHSLSLLVTNRNESRRRDYKAYYTEQTRRIVSEIYADDIRTLGYSFDNSTLSKTLALRTVRLP